MTSQMKPGPQPHNRIAASADEQLVAALVDLPTGHPPESWLGRHTSALENYVAGRGLDRLAKVEAMMATEVMFMIRTAHQLYPGELRALLREIILADDGQTIRQLLRDVLRDVVDGLTDDLRTDVADLADAVAAVERRRAVAA